jgi:ATP-binding cassette subfamily B protein
MSTGGEADQLPDTKTKSPIMRLLVEELGKHRRETWILSILIVLTAAVPIAAPFVLRDLTDQAVAGKGLSQLMSVAILLVVLEAIHPLFDLVTGRLAIGLSWKVSNGIRAKLARHILTLDAAWHGDRTAGELVERIDGDTASIGVFAAQMGSAGLLAGLLITGSLVAETVLHPLLGLTLLVGLLVSAVVMIVLRRFAVKRAGDERSASAALYGDIEERLGALDDLRANNAGEYAMWRHRVLARRWIRDKWAASSRAALQFSITNSMVGLSAMAVLASAVFLYRADRISTGEVLAAWLFAGLARRPLETLAENLKEGQTAMAAAHRIVDVLKTATTVPAPANGLSLPDGPLELCFEQVTFAYPMRPPALRDLNLTVPAGTSLGLVGRTGSGKTTVGRLAARLWDVSPDQGRVTLGGVDLRDVDPAELRRKVAVVTQDVVVFRASIRDNLTLFGTVEASDDQLHKALNDADLGTWAARLPRGLDTEIGTQAGLSGGEAQLLSLARALLASPALVVLDEATARLDPITEARVAAATDRLLNGRTAIVIAHRLATLDEVDAIGVLDRGQLVEHGGHAELSDAEGPFAALLAASPRVERQFEGAGFLRSDVLADEEADPMTGAIDRRTADEDPVELRVPALINAVRLAKSRFGLFIVACLTWWTFHVSSVLVPLAVGAAISSRDDVHRVVVIALVLATLAEVGRWVAMGVGWVSWDPTYMVMIAQQRSIVLRSLLRERASGSARLVGSPGATMNRLRTDPEMTVNLTDTLLDLVGAIGAASLVLFLVGRISPNAAWAMGIPMAVVVGIGLVGGSTLRRRRQQAREAEAHVSHVLADLADGVLTLQLGGGVPSALRRLDKALHLRAIADLRVYIVGEGLASLGSAAAGIGTSLAVVALVPNLAAGTADAGDLALVIGTTGVLAFLPRMASRLIARTKNTEVSFARMAALLPSDRPLKARAREVSGFTHVSFFQDPPVPLGVREFDAPAPALLEARGLVAVHPGGGGVAADLSIEPHSFVVITGTVGSGKSTLLRALLGLHPLVAGSLAWDGRELDRPLCSPQVAYVPQVPRLCSEPLTDAILLGLSPEDRLSEALSVAQLTQDLQVLPDGLETVVGPRGVRLSGGQLQRVALARALVRRPALLVVDDLSSALDVATESALWRDLSEVLADTSVLAVSHRPAVIARADVVITLDDGRVSSVDRRAEPAMSPAGTQ